MVDLDTPQRPYAAALLVTLPIPTRTHSALYRAVGDARIEQRHRDYAEWVIRIAADGQILAHEHLILGAQQAGEFEQARAAQAWVLSAVSTISLILRVVPWRSQPWAQ